MIEVGETAVPSATSIAGSDVLTIADTSNMYAEVNVNETDVALVVPGQTAKIVPAAFPDEAWTGVVKRAARRARFRAGNSIREIRLDTSRGQRFHRA